MKYLLGVIIVLCTVSSGCDILQTEPYAPYINPEFIERVDMVAEIAEPVGATATAIGMLWPPATILGGLIVGAAGAWKKMKPKLEVAKSEAELGKLAGEATSAALEEFKKRHPDEWGSLSSYLRDNHGTTVENFYRGLRGLPTKG